MEVHYKLLRDRPQILDETFAMFEQWPAQTVDSNESWREAAAVVKAFGRLSVVDAWAASLALMEDAALVYKDPEFESVPEMKMVTLPYKPRRSCS
jgi:predicted nucleic acid-binding protein